jgi:AraC-like DNA-binding protein
MSDQVIDIIIMVGIFQGLFLAITLQLISDSNRKANIVLSIILVLAMLMLYGRYVYSRHFNNEIFQWSLVVDSTVFLFGPLMYLYIKRLLFKEYKMKFSVLFHSIPFLLWLGYALILLLRFSPNEFLDYYLEGHLTVVFDIVSIAMMVFNCAYIVLSIMLVRSFRRKERKIISFEQSPIFYLNAFLIAFSLCMAAWIFGFINRVLFDSSIPYFSYEIIWIAIPIFIYVIGYFSLKQPDLFRVNISKEMNLQRKNRLSEQDAVLLKENLDNLIIDHKIFLQSDLTLVDVSERLETSTHNVSWLLNNVYRTTFYDFINGYRIQEFIHKIENKEHLKLTILALSYDVGFNSKSTFNKAFKLNMKDTPSNFIKNHQAA